MADDQFVPANDLTIHEVPQGTGNMATDMVVDAAHADNLFDMYDESRKMEQVEALLFEHPDYCENVDKWRKYLDLYTANNIYRFIYKHLREADDSWKSRVARAYFYNYSASVIDLFVSYLFSVNVTRGTSPTEGDDTAQRVMPDDFEPIMKDADLKGTCYDTIIRTAATLAQTLGWVGVLIDMPRVDQDAVKTEYDRKQLGLRPYMKIVLPQQVLDWSVDEFGKFEWVKIELPPVDDRTYRSKVDNSRRTFLIWDREGWELWEVIKMAGAQPDYRKIDDGESPPEIRGTVPFVVVKNGAKLDHDWMGESSIRDIADINIALMNWSSLGDEEIANRCLNILTMERDNQNIAQVAISTMNVLEYAADTNPPTYLEPGSTPLELIGNWINRGRDEIYRLAKVGGSTGLLGVREATSGIAYAYEFNETNQSLTAKASFMETAETEIFQLISRWLGKEFTGTVSYGRDFGVDDMMLELDTIMKARLSLTSETAVRQMEKNIIQKMFSRMPVKFRQGIEKEIDKAPAIIPPVESFDSAPPALTSGNADAASKNRK